MKEEEKDQPKQDEQKQEVIKFDLHPIKAEPLIPAPASSPAPNEIITREDSLSTREAIYLFIIVLLIVAFTGIALHYGSKFAGRG